MDGSVSCHIKEVTLNILFIGCENQSETNSGRGTDYTPTAEATVGRTTEFTKRN